MRLKFIITVLALFSSVFAVADFPGKSWLERKVIEDEFDLWLGLQVTTAPSYISSNEYVYYLVPIVEVETYNEKPSPFIFDSVAGGGLKLFDYKGVYIGATGYWRTGWKAEDDLDGLDDRDSGLQVAAVLGYENAYGFDAKLISSWGLTGDVKGTIITGKIQQDIRANHWWRVTPGVQLNWGSKEYMNNYFGISEEESQRSKDNLSPYDADAGFRDVRLYVDNTFQLRENIRLYANGYVGFAFDEVKNSPIIRDVGSDITYGGGVGVSFKF